MEEKKDVATPSYEELEKNYSELTEAYNKLKESDDNLKNICHQLSDQSQTLYNKLQEANMTNLFKRLDYLFAVIDNKDAFKTSYPEFYEKCIKEIVDSMTLPEEPPKESKEESGATKAS